MRRWLSITVPAVLQTVSLAACEAAAPADAAADSIDAADAYPDRCDASVSGRDCYDRCLFEGETTPRSCVVFCQPLGSGALYAPCSSPDPDYLCRLTRNDAGAYVECLTIA